MGAGGVEEGVHQGLQGVMRYRFVAGSRTQCPTLVSHLPLEGSVRKRVGLVQMEVLIVVAVRWAMQGHPLVH